MKLKIFRKIILGFSILLFTGCVNTALYGAKFKLVEDNIYTLEITFGSLPQTPYREILATTRKRLDQEAIKYIANNLEYQSYKVVKYKKYVSNVVYTVEFLSEPL